MNLLPENAALTTGAESPEAGLASWEIPSGEWGNFQNYMGRGWQASPAGQMFGINGRNHQPGARRPMIPHTDGTLSRRERWRSLIGGVFAPSRDSSRVAVCLGARVLYPEPIPATKAPLGRLIRVVIAKCNHDADIDRSVAALWRHRFWG